MTMDGRRDGCTGEAGVDGRARVGGCTGNLDKAGAERPRFVDPSRCVITCNTSRYDLTHRVMTRIPRPLTCEVPREQTDAECISVEIDSRIVSPNEREHWAREWKRRCNEHRAVEDALWEYPRPTHDSSWVVQFTRISSKLLDVGDNLPASFKAHRDAVASWLGMDDSDPRITWLYEQELKRVPVLTAKGTTAFKVWARLEILPADRYHPSGITQAVSSRALEKLQVKGIDPAFRREAKYSQDTAGVVLSRHARAKGTLVVTRKEFQGQTFVHLCVHYTSKGKRWRTQGVVVLPCEALGVSSALQVLGEGVVASSTQEP